MSRIREVTVLDPNTDTPILPAKDSNVDELNARIGDNITSPGVTSVNGRLKTLNATLTGGQIEVIDSVHRKIHDGDFYFTSHAMKIKKKQKMQVVFSTPPAPREIHFDRNSSIMCSKESTVKVYAGMTTDGSLGTPIPIVNANGNSTNISGVSIYVDPTGNINPGMLAYTEITGEDAKESGGNKERREVIFRPGLNYMLEVESHGDRNTINIPFEFYTKN